MQIIGERIAGLSVLFNAGQKLTAMIRPATIRPRTNKVMSQKPVSADRAARHAAMTRVSSPKAARKPGQADLRRSAEKPVELVIDGIHEFSFISKL